MSEPAHLLPCRSSSFLLLTFLSLFFVSVGSVDAQVGVILQQVPDYFSFGGSLSTACGNLAGYWDRHGLSDFYTGVTANGLAPLNSLGGNSGIRSLWASAAGLDGRSASETGHINDYWGAYNLTTGSGSYESTAPDPYSTAGRPEHAPDCIADFIGASQLKWTNMNNECDGNIDGHAFVFWDPSGNRRTNFFPQTEAGTLARDIPSGMKEWTRSRGYDAEVFSQLTDFNPVVPVGRGFTFDDLRTEIDAGHPVLLFLQATNQFSRALGTGDDRMLRANPRTEGMLAYGYYFEEGLRYVFIRTSRGDSNGNDDIFEEWNSPNFLATGLPIRGVVGYHPKPKITGFDRTNGTVRVAWSGPASAAYNRVTGVTGRLPRYVLERTVSLSQAFEPVTSPGTNHSAIVADCCPTNSAAAINRCWWNSAARMGETFCC